MTTPTAPNLQRIKELIKYLSSLPCILSAHKGRGQVCAPCEARLRLSREDGAIKKLQVDDLWAHDKG